MRCTLSLRIIFSITFRTLWITETCEFCEHVASFTDWVFGSPFWKRKWKTLRKKKKSEYFKGKVNIARTCNLNYLIKSETHQILFFLETSASKHYGLFLLADQLCHIPHHHSCPITPLYNLKSAKLDSHSEQITECKSVAWLIQPHPARKMGFDTK